jgi:hypothetical protein
LTFFLFELFPNCFLKIFRFEPCKIKEVNFIVNNVFTNRYSKVLDKVKCSHKYRLPFDKFNNDLKVWYSRTNLHLRPCPSL